MFSGEAPQPAGDTLSETHRTLSLKLKSTSVKHLGGHMTEGLGSVCGGGGGSFVPCEQLNFGRISFKGFNPDVEVVSPVNLM
ncbi:hypothetical protein INR49_009469 [Caranx melampygus]|nr:hypothetical protein INR49_009469 [Caranx melampygus]